MKRIFLFLAFFTSAIFGQNILTLEQAIQIALEKNTSVNLAKNNYAIAANNYHIGNAGLLPRLDLSLSTTYNDNYYYVFGNKSYNAYTMNIAGIRASYVLFNGMKNFALYSKYK